MTGSGMRRLGRRRLVAGLVAAVAFVGLLASAILIINGPGDLSSCAGAVGCGWIVPLIAAVVIGAILWLLSGQSPKYDDESRVVEGDCGSCGAPVMDAWRLCPACGARLRN
jgi:hypothetical protein